MNYWFPRTRERTAFSFSEARLNSAIAAETIGGNSWYLLVLDRLAVCHGVPEMILGTEYEDKDQSDRDEPRRPNEQTQPKAFAVTAIVALLLLDVVEVHLPQTPTMTRRTPDTKEMTERIPIAKQYARSIFA